MHDIANDRDRWWDARPENRWYGKGIYDHFRPDSAPTKLIAWVNRQLSAMRVLAMFGANSGGVEARAGN